MFYDSMGDDKEDVFKPTHHILFKEDIPEDTIEYLSEQSVIDAMNWVGTFGDKNTTETDGLHFFWKVSKSLEVPI